MQRSCCWIFDLWMPFWNYICFLPWALVICSILLNFPVLINLGLWTQVTDPLILESLSECKNQLCRYSQILIYTPISVPAPERMSYSILSFSLLVYLFLLHSSTHSVSSPTERNPAKQDNITKAKESVGEVFSCLDNPAK